MHPAQGVRIDVGHFLFDERPSVGQFLTFLDVITVVEFESVVIGISVVVGNTVFLACSLLTVQPEVNIIQLPGIDHFSAHKALLRKQVDGLDDLRILGRRIALFVPLDGRIPVDVGLEAVRIVH